MYIKITIYLTNCQKKGREKKSNVNPFVRKSSPWTPRNLFPWTGLEWAKRTQICCCKSTRTRRMNTLSLVCKRVLNSPFATVWTHLRVNTFTLCVPFKDNWCLRRFLRPACPDLNSQKTPASNRPLRHQSRRLQKLLCAPNAVGADGNTENITGLSVQNDQTCRICPEMPTGINARVDGGVMWGLCLVIRAAGAAAGRASVPPWLCCCCCRRSCQTDQVSQKPQSDLKLSKIKKNPNKNPLGAWSAALSAGLSSAVCRAWGGRWCALLTTAAAVVRASNARLQCPAPHLPHLSWS